MTSVNLRTAPHLVKHIIPPIRAVNTRSARRVEGVEHRNEGLNLMTTILGRGGILWLGVVAVALAGCIRTRETVYRDDRRTPVTFENEVAGQLFHETLDRSLRGRSRTVNRSSVGLPIVFRHERRVIEGDGRLFNEAVARCDTNHDGRISELEARVFASTDDGR